MGSRDASDVFPFNWLDIMPAVAWAPPNLPLFKGLPSAPMNASMATSAPAAGANSWSPPLNDIQRVGDPLSPNPPDPPSANTLGGAWTSRRAVASAVPTTAPNPAITLSSSTDPFRDFPPASTFTRSPATNPVRTLGALFGLNANDTGPSPGPPSAPGYGVVPKQPLPPEFRLPPPRAPDWQSPESHFEIGGPWWNERVQALLNAGLRADEIPIHDAGGDRGAARIAIGGFVPRSLAQGSNGGSTTTPPSQPTPRLGYEPKLPPPVIAPLVRAGAAATEAAQLPLWSRLALLPASVTGALASAILLGMTGPAGRKEDEFHPQYVVRGGISSPSNLQVNTNELSRIGLPGEHGMSSTSAPNMTVDQLAAVARYPNPQITYTIVPELNGLGYRVVPMGNDRNPLHSSILLPPGQAMLTDKQADALSEIFKRAPNPYITPRR